MSGRWSRGIPLLYCVHTVCTLAAMTNTKTRYNVTLRLSSEAYIEGHFNAAYEQKCALVEQRIPCHITPGVAGSHVLVHTTDEWREIVQVIIETAEENLIPFVVDEVKMRRALRRGRRA